MILENLFLGRENSALSHEESIGMGVEADLLHLEIKSGFTPDHIDSRVSGLWRYHAVLPDLKTMDRVSFGEGNTPLLSLLFSGIKLWVKQDHLFSTGSYKDRGASVLISKAKSLNIKHVVQDSSGNAGCAIAAYAAHAGMTCEIYVPATISSAKLKQIQAYGANIHLVQGDREETAKAAREAARHSYYASHCYNPYFLHGTKTFAYEIAEQLNWKVPDAVVLPAGNGTLLLGCLIGFNELMQSGVINRIPRLIAVQSENCAPLYHLYNRDSTKQEYRETLAEGIAIAHPPRINQMLQAVKQTKGEVLTVSETEIQQALKISGLMGFYIEPTAAATIAGAIKYATGYPQDQIVTLFSGHGLKK